MNSPKTSAAAERLAQATILVVDDDPVNRTMMTAALTRAGYAVIASSGGDEAVHVAFASRPDALVIDLMMPGTSGLQAINAIRRDPSMRTMPAIVVSGAEDLDSRVRTLAGGADDFVVKPVSAAELVARVDAQLRITAAWSDVVRAERSATDHSGEAHQAWLASVVDDRAFDIWFQPIVDMRNRDVCAQEALVRFHDGTPPNEVFHLTESTARRVQLELAVVEQAMNDAESLPTGIDLHVNVSPLAAAAPEFVTLISCADRASVIEITENEMFGGNDARALRQLLPPGCRLAADDVGVGYAGLSQLLDVRPDIVKIDRAVVASIDEDLARQALVAGLVQFGAATGCSLIAEGIERSEERDALLALGVVYGQGYHFGRPEPLAEAALLTICVG